MGDRGERLPLGGAPRAGEPRLPVLTGRAWAFADRLRSEDVLPPRFAELPAVEAARRLFADLDPTLAARLGRGDVLVAGQEAGEGAVAPAAARALAAAGIAAVVAGSFAPGFAEAVLAAGLPPLEVDAPAIFHTGQRLRINLEAGVIANLSSGDRLPVRNLSEELVEALRARIGR
jgi:3-isopropylmalate/(R)-2-methylmalate dehydratase small subunit